MKDSRLSLACEPKRFLLWTETRSFRIPRLPKRPLEQHLHLSRHRGDSGTPSLRPTETPTISGQRMMHSRSTFTLWGFFVDGNHKPGVVLKGGHTNLKAFRI